MATIAEEIRAEAIEWLKEACPIGTTVYAVLRHRAGSGMNRVIDFFVWHKDEYHPEGRPYYIGRQIAKLGLYTWDNDREGLRVQGGGMDMAFAVVYDLARALYGDEHKDEHGRFVLEAKWI